MKLLKRRLSEQRAPEQSYGDNLAGFQAELQQLRGLVENVLRQKGASDVAMTAIEDKTRVLSKDGTHAPTTLGVTDQTLLEDVVRRAQWVCEETRREVAKQVEGALQKLEAHMTSVNTRCIGLEDDQAKRSLEAQEEASAALKAAQLSAELVVEAEQAFARQIEQLAERSKLEALTERFEKAFGNYRADLKEAIGPQELAITSIQEAFALLSRDQGETAKETARLGEVVAAVESSWSETEVSLGIRQDTLGLEVKKASLRVDELGQKVEGLQATVARVENRCASEVAAIAENVEACFTRVDAAARHAAEKEGKKAIDAARQVAAEAFEAARLVASDMSKTCVDQGALREAASQEVRAAMAEKAAEIDGVIDKARAAMAEKADGLQTIALDEVRSALGVALEEMRSLKAQVQEAAMAEARAGVAEQCEELLRFAGNLQTAALDEVRKALGNEIAGSLEFASDTRLSPEDLGAVMPSGGGTDAARALRGLVPLCPPA